MAGGFWGLGTGARKLSILVRITQGLARPSVLPDWCCSNYFMGHWKRDRLATDAHFSEIGRRRRFDCVLVSRREGISFGAVFAAPFYKYAQETRECDCYFALTRYRCGTPYGFKITKKMIPGTLRVEKVGPPPVGCVS